MTRDESRAKCIEKMISGFNYPSMESRITVEEAMTRAFDALATVPVTVCPLEATEEMLYAGDTAFENGYVAEVFAAMSAAGDLTNAPEKP